MPLEIDLLQSKEPGLKQSGEQLWLNRLNRILKENFDNQNLCNKLLGDELGISERQLIRVVKKRSGMSPRKYIQQFRLTKAKGFLEKGKFKTVKETSKAVGISKVSYFISQYEQNFGIRPYQVLQDNGWR